MGIILILETSETIGTLTTKMRFQVESIEDDLCVSSYAKSVGESH